MKRSSKPGKITSAHADDIRAKDPLDQLIIEEGLRIVDISSVADGSTLILTLTNGTTVVAPLDDVPQLATAKPAQRKNYELVANGTAIGWEDLDVHLSLKGFLTSIVRSEVIRRLTGPGERGPVMIQRRRSGAKAKAVK
ncbi:MAG: DUF2442 domain-containing protein [Bacteroidetes bacterium]|nr:DUF2442 domain-containing protein [Bacteroidota bacterium]